MGLFCVNFHFRTTDDRALSEALERRGVTESRILPAKRDWISLYEARASDQDEARIRELATSISGDLHVPAIAFLVHDSDVACYWLYEDGQLLDEFNSCPDYFDQDAPPDEATGHYRGRPEVLLRYCRAGIGQVDLTEILGGETVFAESVIDRLADALGIDRERALTDYRDVSAGEGPEGGDGFGDDDDGDDPGSGPNTFKFQRGLAGQLAQVFGSKQPAAAPDPRASAMVQAAVDEDTEAIVRLLDAGVPVDAEAPSPLAAGQAMAGLAQHLPGGAPKVAMTPLLAAVVNKRRRAVETLLERGADPNQVHPLFGTPIHAAAGAGEVELLQILVERGGDVNGRDARGQTPLEVIVAARGTRDRLAQVQAMMKTMGVKLPGLVEQLSSLTMPVEGWDACERLLKERGAR
jgi:hypothetical protein